MGRPSKYKKKYCEEIVKYFDIEPYSVNEKLNKLIPNDLRFLTGFARAIGVCKDTLNEWCTKYNEFSDAYKKVKGMQKEHLIINGLLGLYNPGFACFTAKNITVWRDKHEVEHTGEVKLTKEERAETVNRIRGYYTDQN